MFTLQVSDLDLVICRLPPDAEPSGWIQKGDLVSITATDIELRIN